MAEYKKLKTKKTDDSKVGVYTKAAKAFRKMPQEVAKKKLKTKY